MSLRKNEIQNILDNTQTMLGDIGELLKCDNVEEQDKIIMSDILCEISSGFCSYRDWLTAFVKWNYILSCIKSKKNNRYFQIYPVLPSMSLSVSLEDSSQPF